MTSAKSNISIVSGSNLDLKIIKNSLDVYSHYFGNDDLGPPEEYHKLHLYNPDLYFYAIDITTNNIIGNLEVIPFEDDYLAEYEKGLHDIAFKEGSYPLDKIRQYNLPGFYSIVVELIAINPNYQGNAAVLRALLSAFVDRLLEFTKDDIFIQSIYTDVYSREGKKLAEYFGLKKVRNSIEGEIFKSVLLPPDFIGKFPANTKKLKLTYSKKFEEYSKLIDTTQPPVISQSIKDDAKWDYSIALSFAGEERDYVEQVAIELRNLGVKVFYDNFEQVALWGKDLYQYLNDIYKNRSRYCMVFVSDSYVKKLWTRLEIKSVQARAFESNNEYLLPVLMNKGVSLPGLNDTIGYVDGMTKTPKQLATFALNKIKES